MNRRAELIAEIARLQAELRVLEPTLADEVPFAERIEIRPMYLTAPLHVTFRDVREHGQP